MPKVSVIVPIYNVEKYIERCAVSLFEQTLDDLEYVFVNDCTPDRSMEILHEVLDRYPSRKPQVKIINMEKNSGIAAVRNKGLENVTGEYIIHCDSDDWVELDIYEILYDTAIKNNADIVSCEPIYEHTNPTTITCDSNKTNIVTSNVKDNEWWQLWNRVVKREIIIGNNISFSIGINYGEDVCFMTKIYHYAQHIFFIKLQLYHYNCHNQSSITTNKSDIEKYKGHAEALASLDKWYNKTIGQNNKLTNIKIHWRDNVLQWECPNYTLWRETFPEVVPYVLSNKSLSWAYRKCYAMASKGFYLPFKIYRWLSNLKS